MADAAVLQAVGMDGRRWTLIRQLHEGGESQTYSCLDSTIAPLQRRIAHAVASD